MTGHSTKLSAAVICALLIPTAGSNPLAAAPVQGAPLRSSTASYSIVLHYDPARLSVNRIKLGGKSYIELLHPSAPYSTQEIGRPALPQDVVYVALPQDASDVRVALKVTSSATVATGALVKPLQPPLPTSRVQSPKPDPVPPIAIDKKAYASKAPYPPEVAKLEEVATRFGARVAVIRVSPLVFYAKDQRTDIRTALSGALSFRSAQPTRGLYANLPNAQREALIRTVINPEAISSTSQSVPVAPLLTKADYVLSDVRPAKQETVDYLVITRAALAPSFQPLVDWKTRKGVNARIVTVEWIAPRYAGVDLANKVRNFILDTRAKWGTSWFLLGGDVDQVPARISAYDSYTSSYGPMDLYFSGLGTNWNANGDHVFADTGEEDLDPDVFVGRAPVQNAAQVAVFTGKVLQYEQNPPAGYVERAILMGVHNNLGTDAYKNYSIVPILPPGYAKTRMYDPSSTLAPDVVLNHANAMTQLGLGFHILNHMDHSGLQSMGTGANDGGGVITNADVDSLANALPGGIVWTFGCDPNGFDYDSISEHWLRNPNGGAVAFVGNTRTGYSSQTYQDGVFFNSWFAANLHHLGPIFASTQGSSNWSYFSEVMNLLGDPEMAVWNMQPTAITVTGLGTIKTGPNPVNLSVGGLVAGEEAMVTFRGPNGEVYAGGQTTGGVLSGTLIVHSTSALSLVVTSSDRKPQVISVPVGTSPSAHLYVSSIQVVDTAGNSDQRLEPGESAVLHVTIRNGGGAASAAGTASLSTLATQVTISSPVQALSTIAPAGSQTVDFPIVLTHAFSDGDSLLFGLNTNGAGVEGTNIHVPVFAPVWEQTHTYDDSAGNGNGIPQPGETVKFGLHVINNGYGDAKAVTATLTTSSPAITITDGTATVGNVLEKSSTNSSDTFTLALGAAFNPATDTVNLTLTDSLGNATIQTIKLIVPAAPTGMAYHSTASSITVLWDAAPVPSRNYKIYRSNGAAGPYTKIEPFLVRDGALYEDTAISASQPSYFYRVSIIDAFGNESAPAQLQAWTSLPVLNGFPRPIAPADGGAAGHTMAFDVNGDGKKEIFVTTSGGKLYAWNSSGNEFIPGGDPNFAEFATLDGLNSGAPAFADIDNDGHTDIVVDGAYKIFAFHADGSPLPGWAGGVALPKPACMTNGPSVGFTSPVVADLDGDGHKEIITTAMDWEDYCDGGQMRVVVFNPNGTVKAAYPIAQGDYSYASPAVADLNGDGKSELVVPTGDGRIFVLNSMSSSGLGAPIATIAGASFRNEATLVDLDGDGKLDIVLPSQSDGKVYAFHLDGTPVVNWSGGRSIDAGDAMINQWSYGNTIAAGDLDCDTKPEIVLATERKVYIWKSDGTRKSGWPVLRENKTGNQTSAASPLIDDVNDDGNLDVVLSSSSLVDGGLIYAWDVATASLIAAYPQSIPEVINRTGAVADIDGDGKLELVQAAGSHVYVFNTSGHALPSFTPWTNIDRDAVHSSAVPTASFGAPAIAASNLIVNALDDLFFIGTDSRVYTYRWNGIPGKWQLDWLGQAPIATGGLAQGPPTGQVFFIGADHRVYNYWKNAGQWQLDWLGPTQIATGNLHVSAPGDQVFFVGTDNRVYSYGWNITVSQWQLNALGPAQIATGNVAQGPPGGQIFFVGTDHRVYNYWKNAGQWQLDWLGPAQVATGDLQVSASGDKVFFIGTDHRVYNYWWNVNHWQLDWLGPAQIAAGTFVAEGSGNRVFFIGTDQRVYNYWMNAGQWQLDWLGPTQIAASNLVEEVAANHVFFIGTDQRVYNYWWNVNHWQLDWLGPAPIAASNLAASQSGDHVFFIATDHRVYNYWWDGTQWRLDWLCQ